jgi:heme o synthase
LLRDYYVLAKPGIVYGNAVMIVGGYAVAAQQQLSLVGLLGTLVGSSLIIACGCVCNNILDRRIDARMKRTAARGLVTGAIGIGAAFAYATILGSVGIGLLAWAANLLTVLVGIVGLFFYVVVYGYAKRRTAYGTLVGGISGAIPPVAGYVAVTGRLDIGAVLLFAIMACWQMPHFYAIAIYRAKDYAAANIPIWPLARGMQSTKYQMLVYGAIYLLAAVLLTVVGVTGYVYAGIVVASGAWWLAHSVRGFGALDDVVWARAHFGKSLIVLLLLSGALIIDPWVP